MVPFKKDAAARGNCEEARLRLSTDSQARVLAGQPSTIEIMMLRHLDQIAGVPWRNP